MQGNETPLGPASNGEASSHSQAPRISLVTHAQISAELAEGTRSQDEILEQHGYLPEEWQTATIHWMGQLGEDVQTNGAQAELPLVYSDAFARRQNELAATPSITPEQWAELQFDIEKEGGLEVPLGSRQLSLPDYFRLVRHYSKRLAEDPGTQLRYSTRIEELRQ